MLTEFYHTGLQRVVRAYMLDLGLLPKLLAGTPRTGAEQLAPEDLPGEPRRLIKPLGLRNSTRIIMRAARAQPGTIYELAQRTGFAVNTIKAEVRNGPFVPVDKIKVDGRWQKIWAPDDKQA